MIEPATLDALIGVLYGAAIVLIWIASLRRQLDANTEPMMTPPDIPAWLWLIVAALGGWLASEAWPFLRAQWSANARLRREQELRRIRENEDRFVGALERIAETQSRMERILERIEQSNDYYLRATVTTSMQIDEIRRILRALETTVTLKDRAAGQD